MSERDFEQNFEKALAATSPAPAAAGPRKKHGVPPSTRNFLHALTSKLTQYDQKESIRWPNMYRLGHLLEAAHKIEQDLGSRINEDPMSRETGLKFIESMETRFTVARNGQLDLAPARNIVKQIKTYLEKGTKPSLVRA